ncbi:hypothetical protein GL218_07179 [Daldinia childiae]|uniref:uncharacterized protein n=1 Tax=Daldinia childiae TaxID=326645 RepID=UPI001447176F|nr:uncharacterized protein GL218_07179 [Daldinia childiae]KAF3055700.1 hypothetical protein GL218_07179 [Daldinia childiae]
MANTNNNQYVGRTGAGSQRQVYSSNSTPSPRPTQNQIPLPHYFIVRPGTTKHTASGTVTTPGPIVPLIAVDQLPEWLDLFGIPRELSVEQTVGLRNLGTAIRNPKFYQVYMHNDLQATPTAHQEDYHTLRDRVQSTNDSGLMPIDTPIISTSPSASSSTTLTSAEEGSTASSRVDPISESSPSPSGPNTQATSISNPHTKPAKTRPNSTNTTTGSQHPRFASPAVASSTPPTNPYPFIPAPALAPAHFLPSWLPPSTTRTKPHHRPSSRSHSHHTNGSPSSTYCKHWCHRGTCRWGAQCRYAHEMPTTAAGLRDVGLAHHPAWYTTAVNMAFGPGGFASGGGGGGVLRYREKERVEKRGKKSAGAGAGAGKAKGLDGKSGGGDDDRASTEVELRKEDAAEEKVGGASDLGQKQSDIVEKLVEI